uniref:Porimin isoform X1 n=1 Tax=Geotrypetes seraphini TaxID=260995 RepID=A0A6P8RMG9_GEOSA|nr:porimin isoform X1 [Geotrypetes seraphini]
MESASVWQGLLLLLLAVAFAGASEPSTTSAKLVSVIPTLNTAPNTSTIAPNSTIFSNMTVFTTNTTAPATTAGKNTSSTVIQPTTKGASTNSSGSVSTASTKTVTAANLSTSTATPAAAVPKRTSKFDVGSFIGGIILTLGIFIVLYLACRFYNSRRGVRYRTIDEHEAII